MIISIATITAASLLLFAGQAMARGASDDFCDDIACFGKQTPTVTATQFKEAPKIAWRPGYYKNKKYKRSNRGTFRSWFVSVPRKGPANSRGTFVFSPRNLSWAAYDGNGDLVKSGKAVGGMGYCADVKRACRTPIGRFRVYAKGPANCVSRKYPLGEGGAPMPHCMYFRGGYAVHGSYQVPNYNASHGCIRVHPPAAAWLHRNFMKVGTVVVVKPY